MRTWSKIVGLILVVALSAGCAHYTSYRNFQETMASRGYAQGTGANTYGGFWAHDTVTAGGSAILDLLIGYGVYRGVEALDSGGNSEPDVNMTFMASDNGQIVYSAGDSHGKATSEASRAEHSSKEAEAP